MVAYMEAKRQPPSLRLKRNGRVTPAVLCTYWYLGGYQQLLGAWLPWLSIVMVEQSVSLA